MAYDLLIKDGRVVDGSGGPSFRADVAVQNGKIVGVGKFNESATRTINGYITDDALNRTYPGPHL